MGILLIHNIQCLAEGEMQYIQTIDMLDKNFDCCNEYNIEHNVNIVS